MIILVFFERNFLTNYNNPYNKTQIISLKERSSNVVLRHFEKWNNFRALTTVFKMKILQVNCVYREGSTGKIVASLGDTLRNQGHEVYTCYGLGSPSIDECSEKVCTNVEHKFNALLSRITGIPFGGLFVSNYRIRKIIKTFKPDVVHVHCVNASTMNVYTLLKYLAISGIKTVFTLHAEIFHTGGCCHAYDCNKWIDGCHHCDEYKERVHSWFFDRSKTSYKLMYEAVNSFKEGKLIITAVSPWLTDRAKRSAIMRRYPVVYVPNGLDISIFHYRTNVGLINREKYQKVVLFVTPYFGIEETDLKGGRYLPMIAEQLPEYKFVVVSSRRSDKIGNLPNNIQLWGRAKSQEELSQLYSEADVTLLLSKRETFSMVTAESLCCGTPVVGFKAGGPESIAIEQYSHFVEQGNINAIIEHLKTNIAYDSEAMANQATSLYCQNTMVQMFYMLYIQLV